MYMSYYVFDIQNLPDIYNGKKPKVVQRGPYTYRELRKNIPLLWEHDGNLLTYNQDKTFIFDSENSCTNCSESDVVTTANIVPLVCILYILYITYIYNFNFLLIFLSIISPFPFAPKKEKSWLLADIYRGGSSLKPD